MVGVFIYGDPLAIIYFFHIFSLFSCVASVFTLRLEQHQDVKNNAEM